MPNALSCAEQVQVQNINLKHIRHSKQHRPNNHAQTSNYTVKRGGGGGGRGVKKMYIPIKRKNRIKAHIVIPAIQTSNDVTGMTRPKKSGNDPQISRSRGRR